MSGYDATQWAADIKGNVRATRVQGALVAGAVVQVGVYMMTVAPAQIPL